MSGEFTLSLQEFAKKAGDLAHAVVHDVMVDIATEIDTRSPVGDPDFWIYNRAKKGEPADYVDYLTYRDPPEGYVGGRFRMNWQLGIGTAPTGVIDGVDPANGSIARDRNIGAIPEEAAGLVYYLANNLPYARRLEDGWSRQAPAGIVALTVMDFKGLVERQLAARP